MRFTYPPDEAFVPSTDRIEFAVVAIAAVLIILLLIKHWPLDGPDQNR